MKGTDPIITRHHVLGIYDDPQKMVQAIATIRTEDLGQVIAYSPVPNHAIQNALEEGVSPVRIFTLIGGLLGCIVGFALPIYTSLNWSLITGGKPIISIPPFTVIAFEMTILLASLSSAIGFLFLAGLPNIRERLPYDVRFTVDRFGVLVICTAVHCDAARTIFEHTGAEEIHYESL